MFNNFTFEYPYFLLLIVLFVICSIYCKAKAPSYFIPHLNIFNKVNRKSSYMMNLLKYFVIVFSVVALSSPIKINDTILLKNEGINILLNLDASLSMSEKDMDKEGIKNRFEIVKEIVKDFMDKRVADNIGVVLFGDSVLISSPLSFDKSSQKEMIDYLDVGMAGRDTAIFDSIGASINILKDKKAKSNVIILLSDGEDNASKIPFDVILELVKKYKIKVYTIAIGNANKNLLKTLAIESNAQYYETTSKTGLEIIYQDINRLEKSQIDQNKIVLKDYLFFYPLFFAVISLILLIYLRNKE